MKKLIKFILLLPFAALGQKLPNVQKDGMVAPANIKVDGKDTEWGSLAAHNKATDVSYTMANDANNLYLVVQATGASTIQKILGGGITLTLKGPDKNISPVSIIFPLLSAKDWGAPYQKIKDTATNMASALSAINEQLASANKEIKVKGISQITDTLISVYNTENIKAAVQCDVGRHLTLELALPLTYLEKMMQGQSFKYNIQSNAYVPLVSKAKVNGRSVDPAQIPALLAKMRDAEVSQTGSNLYFNTDFSGTYQLVR